METLFLLQRQLIQRSRISLPLLEEKASKIKSHFKHYTVEYRALSPEDM